MRAGIRNVPVAGPPAPTSARPRWLVLCIVTAVIVAVAITATLIFLHWRNGLRLFEDAGDEVGADHLRVGQTFYVPSVYSPTKSTTTLTLTSMTPVVTTNTAHATIEVLACTPRPASPNGWATTSRSGSGVRRQGRSSPAGTSVADVRVKYERGLRRGDQRVGFEVDTRTP